MDFVRNPFGIAAPTADIPRWSRFQSGKPKGKVNFVPIINVQVRINVSFRAFQTNLQVPGTQTVATWKNDWPNKNT